MGSRQLGSAAGVGRKYRRHRSSVAYRWRARVGGRPQPGSKWFRGDDMDTHGSSARAGTRALISLLVGRDRDVAHWVGRQLGIEDFGPCVAIGIIRDDELIAGAVFHGYREANIEISFASTT